MTVPFISSEDTPKMLSPFASRLVIWRNNSRKRKNDKAADGSAAPGPGSLVISH